MRLRDTLPTLAAAAILPLSSPSHLATSGQVRIAPLVTHPGGLLYVSGARFPAHRQLTIRDSCAQGASTVRTTSRADGRGHFVAVKLTAPSRAGSGRCRVEVLEGSSGPGGGPVNGSAPYTVWPATRPLPACSIRMCLQVQALLVRLRSGAEGDVTVSGWPGAVVHAQVLYPNGHVKSKAGSLDWRGVGLVKLPVAPGLLKGTRARVLVTARLGVVSGRALRVFTVVPGGR